MRKTELQKAIANPTAEATKKTPKDGILEMDAAGNYITQEPNGSFKVWRAGITNASLAGTIGFKGEEGLRRAKERLAALTPTAEAPKAQDSAGNAPVQPPVSPEESNPTISGYEPDMTERVLDELASLIFDSVKLAEIEAAKAVIAAARQ
jgi:hypothetical protein